MDVRRRHVMAMSVVLLSFAELGANCVDGFTPDCSDPNVQCGPGPLDAASLDVNDGSITLPEAAPDVETDTGADAGDAGDAADGG